jgi:hypothetical protein
MQQNRGSCMVYQTSFSELGGFALGEMRAGLEKLRQQIADAGPWHNLRNPMIMSNLELTSSKTKKAFIPAFQAEGSWGRARR